MQVTEGFQNGVAILYLDGRFDASTSGIVQESIDKWIRQGVYFMVIDMTNVSFIASAGLRVVLAMAKELRTHQGDLRFGGLIESVDRVFQISGLKNVLRIFDTSNNAFQSFFTAG